MVVTAALLVGARAASAQEQVPPPPYEPTPPPPQPYTAPPYNPPSYNPPPYRPPPYRPPPRARVYRGYPAERLPAPVQPARVPVEVTPSAGYAFSTGVGVVGGTLALAPAPVFGATVDIGYWYGARFEVSYVLQNTTLWLTPDSGGGGPQYDVTAHHFGIGGEVDLFHGPVRPFLGVTLGAEWLAPHADVPDELWFEASFEAGAKVRLTRFLGIRAQAQFTSIAMDSRSQVFCQSGCYTAWYGIGSSVLALSAGPTLAF